MTVPIRKAAGNDGRTSATQQSRLTAALWSKLANCHFLENLGAGEGIRTLDPDLGKVVLYH
jgi:hypothetical protein